MPLPLSIILDIITLAGILSITYNYLCLMKHNNHLAFRNIFWMILSRHLAIGLPPEQFFDFWDSQKPSYQLGFLKYKFFRAPPLPDFRKEYADMMAAAEVTKTVRGLFGALSDMFSTAPKNPIERKQTKRIQDINAEAKRNLFKLVKPDEDTTNAQD